jgi:ParB family chromosome partitioning protein
MELPKGKSRLDLVKEGAVSGLSRRGRLIVSLDKLLEDPKNERKTFRNMEGMVASIKAVGLVEPITVTPIGDKFRILTGHRRARAAKLANLREVEVLIREDENELLRRRKSLISNVQREDIGAVELAEALRAMLDEENGVRSQRELAQMLGKREAWVSDMLRLLTLPPELQQKLRHAELSIPYDTLMRVARVNDLKVQRQLVDLSLSGTAAPEMRKRIDEFKERTSTPTRKSKLERVSVIVEGYTASVSGPASNRASEAMKAAIEELREKLDEGDFAKAA